MLDLHFMQNIFPATDYWRKILQKYYLDEILSTTSMILLHYCKQVLIKCEVIAICGLLCNGLLFAAVLNSKNKLSVSFQWTLPILCKGACS